MKKTLVLGIEATAHTFGASVIETSASNPKLLSKKNTRILSNASSKYPSTGEGFIPRKLADHHSKNLKGVLEEAFSTAKISPQQLSAVAFSYGPGIGHSLHLGFVAAKTLSLQLNVPLIPVNHALAHVEIGKYCCNCRDPLAVYVSGGNTQIICREGDRYKVFGETLDIGLGNFVDSLGRKLQTKPPDAIGLLKEAASYEGELLELPYTVKGMNVSFTGLQTAIEELSSKHSKASLCFAAQEYSFSMLLEAVERALVLVKKKEVLLVGGNARNQRLQQMLSLLCGEHKVRCCVVPFEYAGDNGAMIAFNGLQKFLSKDLRQKEPDQKTRIDRERIAWV